MSSKKLFIAGFGLVLFVNVIVLAGVAYNRSGAPESVITLSSRELTVRESYESDFKNSAISLRLDWRALGREKGGDDRYYYSDWGSPLWLDDKKLKELGFDIKRYSKQNADRYQDPIENEICLVLENNGESYREAVKRAEKALSLAEAKLKENVDSQELRDRQRLAEEDWKDEVESRSRLFVIDAGIDAEGLRAKYPDRTRYLITKGIVTPYYEYSDGNAPRRLSGRISRLGPGVVHLPLEYAKILGSFKKTRDDAGCGGHSCYEAEFFFGKRLEPWIKSLKEAPCP